VTFKRTWLPLLLSLAFAASLVAAAVPPVVEGSTPSELQQVLTVAESKLKDPWVHYAKGPDKFDCVGFVWYAFHYNDLQSHIGGYRGVKSYYSWFKARGLTSQSNPQPGDLIIWGRFKHIGIYIGDGMAVSALINPYGVTIHKVKGYIHMKVRAYLHTNLTQ
jgi:cell wall-associated NlpC family hydrolase